jgi:hypothetical protein
MINAVKFATSVLALATACLAQEGLTIDNKHKERMSTPEAEKIYFSACSVVEEEFVINHPILPRVKLVLGANKNVVVWAEREIWPYEMGPLSVRTGGCQAGLCRSLTGDRKIAMTQRAVSWADSTVEIERLAK